jgi:PAS domain S-box-containing protein
MPSEGPLTPLPSSSPHKDSREPVTILMVDDQPSKLITYEVILADLNERLVKATSGREALDHLLKSDVAVVLMDVSMPEIDGFELADMIRQHPRFQKTPIIFISAVHLTDIDRIRAYQSGAVDYISVPVIPEVLRAKVSVFVELYRKTRELQTLNRELEQRVAERSEELRKLNAELQQRVATLRERAELLDLATEAIMVRDFSGTIGFWNAGAEALYGWTREEAIGRNAHSLLATEVPGGIAGIRAALQSHGRWEGNLRHRTRDGREIIVASRHAMQQNGAAVLEINRDITAQLLAEEALRRNERLAAMGKLAGIVAHEINNPLEAITNTFYLLSTHSSLDDVARHYAELADQELARVSHITKQTLSFYRESQTSVPVLLSEILENVLELQERSLKIAGIVLEKRYSVPGMVYGFPSELKQVFMNLVSNAIQAMPEGGRLRISMKKTSTCHSHNGCVSVFISDNGSGITAEHSKRLFEPFFTTKSVKGTGLGLWISRGIVQKHDGVLRFRSLFGSVGSATSFEVVLPNYSEV